MVTAIILAVMMGLAGLIIIGQLALHSLNFGHGSKLTRTREAGPKLEEYQLEDNDSQNKIAVITVDGIIT
jgi:uncharacterized protein YxeA